MSKIRSYNQQATEKLFQAIQAKDLQAAKQAIDDGADVTVADLNGNTPLLVAAALNHLGIARLLIEKNANVDVANEHGYTPLLLALDQKHWEMGGLLIEKNADANIANQDGKRPLLVAVYLNNLEIVGLLIEKRANVDGADRCGTTPLLLAIVKNNLKMVSFLLEKKADANIGNVDGVTPLYCSILRKNAAITKIILKHGVNFSTIENLVDKLKDNDFNEIFCELGSDIKISIIESIYKTLNNEYVNNDLHQDCLGKAEYLSREEDYINKKEVILKLAAVIISSISDSDIVSVIQEKTAELIGFVDDCNQKLIQYFADNFTYHMGVAKSFSPGSDEGEDSVVDLPSEIQSKIGEFVLWNLCNPEAKTTPEVDVTGAEDLGEV